MLFEAPHSESPLSPIIPSKCLVPPAFLPLSPRHCCTPVTERLLHDCDSDSPQPSECVFERSPNLRWFHTKTHLLRFSYREPNLQQLSLINKVSFHHSVISQSDVLPKLKRDFRPKIGNQCVSSCLGCHLSSE